MAVVLVARREALLDEVGKAIAKDFKVQYRTVVADLSQAGFLENLAKATDDLDIGLVVFNAGTGNPGEFLKIDREQLESLLRLHTLAHLDIAHHFGQKLGSRGRGGLLLVGALGASNGLPYMANDGGAKAYVHLRAAHPRQTVAMSLILQSLKLGRRRHLEFYLRGFSVVFAAASGCSAFSPGTWPGCGRHLACARTIDIQGRTSRRSLAHRQSWNFDGAIPAPISSPHLEALQLGRGNFPRSAPLESSGSVMRGQVIVNVPPTSASVTCALV
jgi:hypothetical protein